MTQTYIELNCSFVKTNIMISRNYKTVELKENPHKIDVVSSSLQNITTAALSSEEG